MEKTSLKYGAVELPIANGPHHRQDGRRQPRSKTRTAAALIAFGIAAYVNTTFLLPAATSVLFPDRQGGAGAGAGLDLANGCKQPAPLFPSEDANLDSLLDLIGSDSFRDASVKRLSGAVQVRSESFDDLGAVGEDERWDVFFAFADYLQTTFPLVHAHLRVEKVNTHGLLYTWTGSDAQLKPTLLMAHQDTVPVPAATIPAWTHPPWSGFYDGTYLWGRGASDCKNQLIAILESVELLLQAGFRPRRTVLLSFGFDEESSGYEGAGHLAPFIRERYGDDGIAVIVDEGSGFEESWGTLFAKPGTAEKGYTDVLVTVRMPGGHSSVPPDHTSIGVLAELIGQIEAGKYPTRLDAENPYYAQLQCGAAHSPEFPPKLRKLLAKRVAAAAVAAENNMGVCKNRPDELALEAAKEGGPMIQYLMQTSQAVDVIAGGVKVNALPERVQATVNHRVNVGETPEVVWERLTKLAAEVATRHNLSLHAFDDVEAPSSIMLSKVPTTLDVAPVTPTGESDLPWQVLAGTVRALYGEEVVVVPGIMTGNTDTRYYWALTRHIYRFGPGHDPADPWGMDGIHTVNEKISMTFHVNAVKWFLMFVRNMDEVDV